MPQLLLASQSPRRKQLLESAGYTFSILPPDVDETPPAGMAAEEVAEHLAVKKARATPLAGGEIVVAADTLVFLEGDILSKPEDAAGARNMLARLAGKTHTVTTGVCIKSATEEVRFSVHTEVTFRALSAAQIAHYVATQPPLDKSGSYAIHEWIGLIAIERIDGDYYSVMGLPIGEVVRVLEVQFGLALVLKG